MNRVLEIARTEKLIGSSLDAKVYLQTSDASLASRLYEMCAATNDVDTLHRIFITSQVCCVLCCLHLLVPKQPYLAKYK